MSEQNLQMIQVNIPPPLVRKAKAAAALAGVSLSVFCAQALVASVQHLPDKAPRAA